MINVPLNLYELISICSSNMKGLTKSEYIEKLLPIETDKIKILKDDKKIIILSSDKISDNIWMQEGCYSNIDLLTSITKAYKIAPKSNKIIELMKYKYKIDNMFLKEIKN